MGVKFKKNISPGGGEGEVDSITRPHVVLVSERVERGNVIVFVVCARAEGRLSIAFNFVYEHNITVSILRITLPFV